MSDPQERARSVGRWLLVATIGALLVLVLNRRSHPLASPLPEDAVRAVLMSQVDAWNRGDLDGFMDGYWNSNELTFCSGGTITRGWQPTLDRYRKRYQAEGREMGQLTFEDVHVDILTDDTALVRGRWKLVLSGSRPEGLFTLRLSRFPQGWRVVYDHTSAAE